MKLVALAGGVGAAKLLRGLVAVQRPEDVTVVGNTGDDAVIHGLHVSPDLDIVTYTLAGRVHPRGWGFEGDSLHALEQMRAYGAPAWFTLGDRDIGTHLARTAWLGEGLSLTEITDRIRAALGVRSKIVPMSDHPVPTKLVTTDGAERQFQDYFVKFGHREQIRQVRFEGSDSSRPAPGVLEAIASADRILICPSNPVLSIGPILSVPGIRESIAARREAVTAISPIVRGSAIKGPAAELLPVWGAEASAAGVAGLYSDMCGTFVIDILDSQAAPAIRDLGMEALVLDTMMTGEAAATRLAAEILAAWNR